MAGFAFGFRLSRPRCRATLQLLISRLSRDYIYMYPVDVRRRSAHPGPPPQTAAAAPQNHALTLKPGRFNVAKSTFYSYPEIIHIKNVNALDDHENSILHQFSHAIQLALIIYKRTKQLSHTREHYGPMQRRSASGHFFLGVRTRRSPGPSPPGARVGRALRLRASRTHSLGRVSASRWSRSGVAISRSRSLPSR